MGRTRDDVLHGFRTASQVHQDAAIRERYLKKGGRIDVYGLAADLDIPVMFQDLDGLLGAYLADPTPGILVTKKRPPAVQRFTCAHELGHYYLKHEESLDEEQDIGFALSGHAGGNEKERQADAFAFSFLMPKWLLIMNLKRLDGSGLRFDAPTLIGKAVVAYQLALRVGCSYTATLTTLQHFQLLPDQLVSSLAAIKPRDIKEHLLSEVMVPDWRRDVWLVTEADDGIEVDASPEDLFIVRVREPSTAGYRTKLSELAERGFSVLKEGYKNDPNQGSLNEVVIGSFPQYEVVTQHQEPGRAALDVLHSRPWEPAVQAVPSLHLDLDLRAAAQGLSFEERQKRLGGVAQYD